MINITPEQWALKCVKANGYAIALYIADKVRVGERSGIPSEFFNLAFNWIWKRSPVNVQNEFKGVRNDDQKN